MPAKKGLKFSGNFIFMVISILVVSLLFFSSSNAHDDAKGELAKAKQLYLAARFDEAIEILKRLSSDSTDPGIQKDALRFLGKSYAANQLYAEAKNALIKLMKLEPPIIVFDPDDEPPKFMKLYYDTRKELYGSYYVERSDPGMKTMAVIDFKNRSVNNKTEFDPMEKGFADLLINSLNNSTGLKVIERERIQWILDEMKIQDQYEMEGAVRMGKQLGVHTVLLGSFIIFNKEIWLGARLVKIETGEIILTDEIKGDLDDFFGLVKQLGTKIAKKIGVSLAQLSKESTSDSRILDAMMAYSSGLGFLEQEDYKNAYSKFQEALKIDPNYDRARARAQSITPFL